MKKRSEPGKGAAAVGASSVTVDVIPIIALAREQAFQVRKKLDEGTVKRYVGVYRSGKSMPPVKVAKVNGVPVLVDGWHRVAALERMGTAEVEAEVSTMTRQEAEWAAAFANMEHGKPLRASEVKTVYMKYMKTKQYKNSDGSIKSYREIGAVLGMAHTTIRNWEFKYFPAVAKARGEGMPLRDFSPEQANVEPEELRKAEEALAELARAFSQSSDARVRGDIVEKVERALMALREAGNWEAPPF